MRVTKAIKSWRFRPKNPPAGMRHLHDLIWGLLLLLLYELLQRLGQRALSQQLLELRPLLRGPRPLLRLPRPHLWQHLLRHKGIQRVHIVFLRRRSGRWLKQRRGRRRGRRRRGYLDTVSKRCMRLLLLPRLQFGQPRGLLLGLWIGPGRRAALPLPRPVRAPVLVIIPLSSSLRGTTPGSVVPARRPAATAAHRQAKRRRDRCNYYQPRLSSHVIELCPDVSNVIICMHTTLICTSSISHFPARASDPWGADGFVCGVARSPGYGMRAHELLPCKLLGGPSTMPLQCTKGIKLVFQI